MWLFYNHLKKLFDFNVNHGYKSKREVGITGDVRGIERYKVYYETIETAVI